MRKTTSLKENPGQDKSKNATMNAATSSNQTAPMRSQTTSKNKRKREKDSVRLEETTPTETTVLAPPPKRQRKNLPASLECYPIHNASQPSIDSISKSEETPEATQPTHAQAKKQEENSIESTLQMPRPKTTIINFAARLECYKIPPALKSLDQQTSEIGAHTMTTFFTNSQPTPADQQKGKHEADSLREDTASGNALLNTQPRRTHNPLVPMLERLSLLVTVKPDGKRASETKETTTPAPSPSSS